MSRAESLKARCGPFYAWSFSRRETRTLNRLKSGKAYQMTNVIPFKCPASAKPLDPPEKDSENVPYFDLVHIGDRVIIDANVSAAVGMKIAQLILEDNAAGLDGTPKPRKRSRKATAE
jgi:hypothetical protein